MAMRDGLRDRLGGGRILLGGHRGNSAEFPENTLAAFSSALDLAVDVIECDVHLSADGGLPVIHDHLLDRTTNGSGLIRDQTMAELKSLDAGSWKGPQFAGERIPDLSEVLALARGRAGVAVEIKNLPLVYPGIERAVVDALEQADMVEDVIVIAFDHRALVRIRELNPKVLTGVLEASRPVNPLRVMADAGADVFCPHWGAIDPETAAELHAAGKLIGVWTVDDPVALAWSRALPANAIYTNRPRDIRT
ncbi:MAG TPA: glycerophosphodiester phosphodiesterase family protein [Candidatus Limnocylindrales bacterium]|nr:glycerophosphodiester phosphodiesterase family protein [Candidatus Limnocylindrales bacterium]